jgi:diadenosine tetraphosphate (Ap4A) HIT family hydrolase
MTAFALNPGLTRSATAFLELPLSTVLLKEDARWPWLLLVPRIPDVRDMGELSDADAGQLMREVGLAARAVTREAPARWSNVGALGNIVTQLHVHVVGRWPDDPAWPGPVWGVEGKLPYGDDERRARAARLRERLLLNPGAAASLPVRADRPSS